MASPRTSLELYRDCLRLVRHIAPGYTPKAQALKLSVRSQFKANMNETNEQQIEIYKANAIRALSNYMLYQSAQKDPQLQQAMNKKNKKTSSNTKENDNNTTTTNTENNTKKTE